MNKLSMHAISLPNETGTFYGQIRTTILVNGPKRGYMVTKSVPQPHSLSEARPNGNFHPGHYDACRLVRNV
ncbi:hypothetical protein CW304_13470 [Bacillus sp. UFRGS-B20]|nr:hypothetical protein CW304_13470 [Bacillus sp. UFRGS-B20]